MGPKSSVQRNTPRSYAQMVTSDTNTKKVNFQLVESHVLENFDIDVKIPLASVVEASAPYENTLYGILLVKELCFL